MSNRTIYIQKDLDGRMWYVTDNITDVVGKGISRASALACYNRGIELWQMKQAGYDRILECSHTLKIEHAVNFEAVKDEETGAVLYYQEKMWIPCNERLPEEHVTEYGTIDPSDYVLVYLYFGENNVGNRFAVSRYWTIYASRYAKNPWLDLDDIVADNVVAWMPLPKPYM